MAIPTQQFSQIDVIAGPSAVGPAGAVRITRDGSGLVASVDGGAPTSIGAGGSAATDWTSYGRSIFAAKTGLSALAFAKVYDQDFVDSTNVALSGTFTAAGTGAVQSGTALGTGITTLSGPSSGAGSIKWWAGPTPQALFPQLRTKRWMVWMRIAAAAAPVSSSVIMAGLNNAGVLNTAGIGWVGTATTWHYVRNSVQGVDLGVSIDSSGNVYVNCYFANFDLANVVANCNPGVASDTVCEAVSNLVNGASFPEIAIAPPGSVAGQDKLNIDKYVLFAEM